MNLRLCAALLLACAAPLAAQPIDDSDLGGSPALSQEAARALGQEARSEGKAQVFPAARGATPQAAPGGTVSGSFELADRSGAFLPARLGRARLLGTGASGWVSLDASGRFALRAPEKPSGSYRVRLSLDNPYWAFRNPKGGTAYEWESPAFDLAPGSGLELGAVRIDPAAANGKLGLIHLTYLEALDFLAREANRSWWTKPLTINWPGEADFFSPGGWSLSLTDPLAWDVTLHELGHAVMDGAMKAVPAGGQHFIDRCYSPALAWSEGWASFFAAAVRLRRDDPDAKFEFLVKRIAPIRLENVPEKVCAGEGSEWRVAAGLWDLLDTHPDGRDAYALSFPRLWRALEGESMGSLSSAWALVSRGLSAEERKAAEGSLIQNTLIEPRPDLLVALPPVPAGWAAPAAPAAVPIP